MARAAHLPGVTTGLPAAYAGPWPEMLREALAYHEAGHAIMAAHHGLTIIDMWIADGRPERAGEYPEIHGECLVANNKSPDVVDHMFIPYVFQIVGPVGSEPLAPHRKEFSKLEKKYPDFFPNSKPHHSETCHDRHCPDRDFLSGTLADIERAFAMLLPIYQLLVPNERTALMAFGHEFRIPTVNALKQYEPVVHALARVMIDKRYIKGDEAHAIICQNNPENMPGCLEGSVGHALQEKIVAVQKEFDKHPEDQAEMYRMLMDKMMPPSRQNDPLGPIAELLRSLLPRAPKKGKGKGIEV
jgi:hypothetical protein